jgi:hypothetical protein
MKKPSAKVMAISIALGIFFLMHFNIVSYRDQGILVFHLEFIRDLRTGDQDGIILGAYTLESELGSITVKPFSWFTSASYLLGTIRSSLLGRIDYDLVILGNKITPDWISFSYTVYVDGVRDIDSIAINQDLTVGPYQFNVQHIGIKRKDQIVGRGPLGNINSLKDIDTHEIWLEICDYPDMIELADGTEIKFPVKDRDRSYWFIVHKTDTWIINGSKSKEENSISVKLPGEEEFAAYKSVNFEKDWGRFIEGVPFKVQEEPRFSAEDLLLMERFGMKDIYDEYLKNEEE